jgi:nucleoside-diphosphate-sugar epimerase
MKTVLVLGANGLIGSRLRERLRADYRVVATTRSGAGADVAFALEQASSTTLFDTIAPDVVVNCTVAYGPTLEEAFATNVHQTGALFMALMNRPVHLVQISTISALPENKLTSEYSITKALADDFLEYCAQKGSFETTLLRFAQIFDRGADSVRSQPGLHAWVEAMKARRPIEVFGRSPKKRSYIAAEVVVNAIELAIREEIHGAHDVIAPESYTPNELAHLLAELGGYDGSHIRVVDKPAPGYWIPACSRRFESWISQQKPTSFFFAQLFEEP